MPVIVAPPPKASKTGSVRRLLDYVVGYIFYAIFVLLAAYLLFRIRINVIQIAFLLINNAAKVRGISNTVVVISGIGIFAVVMFGEDYLRKGIEQHRMWKHLLRIFALTCSAILFSLGLNFVLLIIYG